jgi:hypothetical protein
MEFEWLAADDPIPMLRFLRQAERAKVAALYVCLLSPERHPHAAPVNVARSRRD